MSKVTAKVKVWTKSESGEGDSRQSTVTFGADYSDGRNKEWSLYTPSLQLTMMLRGDVADRFVVGKEYTLTFEEGEE